jgi:hypothetical protein
MRASAILGSLLAAAAGPALAMQPRIAEVPSYMRRGFGVRNYNKGLPPYRGPARYADDDQVARAIRRAFRYLKSHQGAGGDAPTHIREKIALAQQVLG